MSRDDVEKFLPLTEPTYYILVALIEPLHGYGIMQKIEAMTGGAIQVGPGTLYGALTTLEQAKLIAKAGQEQRRKIYELTPKGRQVLEKQVERLDIMTRNGRDALGIT